MAKAKQGKTWILMPGTYLEAVYRVGFKVINKKRIRINEKRLEARLGKVVKAEIIGNRKGIAVEFSKITQDDADDLAREVLRRIPEIIREKGGM